ncbi:hypothetical protein JCGZ_18521 [Jatropha curcas]|uniref:SAWADEE domain-containing protein n=1 Tax=Jatropha curcas TaxID=180498 RepID=A0A067K1E2_JATCU|nr:hypothetical protein JCGZ_18521 [Jatropha curcas]
MSLPIVKPGEPRLPSGYDVEYRAIADDAWYSVRTVLNGEKLTVKYDNFSDENDSIFEPQNFKSVAEIEDFEKRFRPISIQLQDRECKNVPNGAVVCASHSFTGFDVRFFDAVVDDVHHRDHSMVNGEEQCMCVFVVTWTHGPNAGFMNNKKIESICLIDSNMRLDPVLASFSRIVREKLETAAHKPHLHSICGALHEDTSVLPFMNPESTFLQQFTRASEKMCSSQSMSNRWTSKESERIYIHAQRIKEEIDIGGVNNHHVLLIDNLDKDLTPSTVVEFLHRQISVSVQAYVFPSLLSETYTNGAVVLDCEKNFQQLCEFLDSPNHIIVSWRGRSNKLEYRNKRISNDLKLIQSGSEEFKTAKRMRDLFMEFSEHQQRLHKRLALEERKILRPSL